jgi:hypothetical protein
VDGAVEQLLKVGFYGGLAAVVDVPVVLVDVAEIFEQFVQFDEVFGFYAQFLAELLVEVFAVEDTT